MLFSKKVCPSIFLIQLTTLIILAGDCSLLELPEGCFYTRFCSINRISLIWFGTGLIWCKIGAGTGARYVVCVEGLSKREWIWCMDGLWRKF